MMVGKGIFGEGDNFFVVHEVLDPQYTRWRFFFTIYVSEFLATSLFDICQLKRGIGLAAYFELLHRATYFLNFQSACRLSAY